jgi:hypothetical protein
MQSNRNERISLSPQRLKQNFVKSGTHIAQTNLRVTAAVNCDLPVCQRNLQSSPSGNRFQMRGGIYGGDAGQSPGETCLDFSAYVCFLLNAA